MRTSSGQHCTDILGLESFLSQAHGMIRYGPASLPTTPLRCCRTYSPYGTLVSHWDGAGRGSDGQPAPSSCHRFPLILLAGGGMLLSHPTRLCPAIPAVSRRRRAAEKLLGSRSSGCDVPNSGSRRSGMSTAVLGAGLLRALPPHPPDRGAGGPQRARPAAGGQGRSQPICVRDHVLSGRNQVNGAKMSLSKC